MTLRAFSLLEVLVALIISASLLLISGNLFDSMFDHRRQAESIRYKIAIETALQLLAADIEHSAQGITQDTSIRIENTPVGGYNISFKKSAFAQGSINLQHLTIVWSLSPQRITRSVTGGSDPMVLVEGDFDLSLKGVASDMYYLNIADEDLEWSIALWREMAKA